MNSKQFIEFLRDNPNEFDELIVKTITHLRLKKFPPQTNLFSSREEIIHFLIEFSELVNKNNDDWEFSENEDINFTEAEIKRFYYAIGLMYQVFENQFETEYLC